MSSQHESKLKNELWKAHAKVLESINKKKKSFYSNIFDIEIMAWKIDHFEISRDFYELNYKTYKEGENLYLLL
jgi:hypothetical protein